MRILDTDIAVEFYTENIGLFEGAFLVADNTKEVIEMLIEWLSLHCIDNFIVVEKEDRIVAGGYSDNKMAFLDGQFDIECGTRRKEGYIGVEYEIRLMWDDVFQFRLRWIDENS